MYILVKALDWTFSTALCYVGTLLPASIPLAPSQTALIYSPKICTASNPCLHPKHVPP